MTASELPVRGKVGGLMAALSFHRLMKKILKFAGREAISRRNA